MANKKFSEFVLKTSTSDVSHIVGYNGAENVQITPANFVTGGGTGVFLPLAGGTMVGNTIHNDNVKSIYGTASDGLKIYHSGSNSIIEDTGTGILNIKSSNQIKLRTVSNEDYLVATETGSVDLYYNNSKKFETTSLGALVTGDLGINTTPTVQLEVKGSTFSLIRINGANTFDAGIDFGDTDDIDIGRIRYTNIDDSMQFWTNGSEKMRLDSNGNLGLGTVSPSEKLEVAGDVLIDTVSLGSNGGLEIKTANNRKSRVLFSDEDLSSVGRLVYDHTTNVMEFWTSFSEKMRLDASGNLGIGTSTPSEKLTVVGGAASRSTFVHQSGYGGIQICGSAAGSSAALLFSNDYNNTITPEYSIVMDGSNDGLAFVSGDPNDIGTLERMRISAAGDIDITSGGVIKGMSYLELKNNGGAVPTATSPRIYSPASGTLGFAMNGGEKIRISSAGDLLINNTAGVGGAKLSVETSAGARGIGFRDTAGISGTKALILFSTTAEVGSISINSTSTGFNTSSDYRLKEDLQDFEGLDLVSKIPVYDYKWKADDSRSYGVMAHELEEVLPQAVSGEKDAEEMQSVDYSKIVPLLVKSIQELSAKLEALECQCEKK